MANRTINDEIIDIISYELKNIHFPSECIITKIYENNYVDIESTIYGSLTYVKACGDYDINEKSILLFLNNELSSPIVIGGSDNDISDLIELITQLKNELMNKVDKVYGKGLSTNDFTDTLKSKLDNIENGANKITVDSLLSSTSTNPLQNKSINTALNNKVDKINGKYLSTNDFTDTLKSKLDAIEEKANKIVVDSALSSTSTNPVQNKVINTSLGNKVDKVSGKGLSTNDFTSTLKTKLDGISEGANKTTVDSALSSTSTNPLQNKAINTALNNKVDKVSGKSLSTNDFTNDLKTKLDGIATGATKVTVDSALSSTSTNPLQNKAINTALNGKANASHTHKKSDLIHYDGGGTSGTAGYVKLLQIKVNSTYSNVPISFDIYQRGSIEPSHCSLMFANANTVDPAIGSFTYTGNQRNIYIYKESTSTWSLIVQKSENYDTIHVNNVDTGHSYMDSKVTFTALNTHISTLPTTNLTQATFIGFTSAEKTKLSGIATGANKTTVDSALSSTSTNPVQNKIINNAITAINGSNIKLNASSNSSVEEAINGKASSSHTHNNVVTQNIPQNADLNSYTTVGVYRNGSNAQVQTMNNTPWGNKPSNGQAFVMVVLDHAGVTQILRPYHINDFNIYTRNYYNGSWGAWKTIYTTGNVGLASSSADGFMAKGDKSKLDGIATGATKVTVDSALSSTSTNPLQNKAINTALNGKAPNSHASTGNTYGLGSTTNYGHVKTINSLTQSSHSDGTALSAYQGKVLNDNITNASRIKLRFGTSNSTTSYSTTPLSISIVKGNNVYVSCVNYAGTAMGGKVILEINGGLYERTLSGGVCSLTINLIAGSYTLRAYYHNNGEFITSGVCKITVT